MSCVILFIVNSGTCLSVLSGQLNHNTGRYYSLFFFFLFVTHHCNTYKKTAQKMKKGVDKKVMEWYYSEAFSGRGSEGSRAEKKNGEKRKKFLTKGRSCARLSKLPAWAGSALYLVNWITQRRTNTLTINGLFKRFRTNNSQRKFLSIFARRITWKTVLSLQRFKIQFFESLILAQDERWRRA